MRRAWLALGVATLGAMLAACGGGGGGGSGMPGEVPSPPPPPPPATQVLTVAGTGDGSITSDPSGIDCGTTCSASYPTGTSVVLTARPAAGQVLQAWGGACTGASATCSVSMDAARSVTATFTSAPAQAGWTSPENVSGPSGPDADPLTRPVLAAVDDNGQALVVWYERQPAISGPLRLMASRRTAAGWTVPVLVAPGVTGREPSQARLAMDPRSGRAMLVWKQPNGRTDQGRVGSDVLSSAFDPAAGWGPITAVETLDGAADGDLRIGMDGSGRAVAAWEHDPDGVGAQPNNVYASRYVPGSGWSPVTNVSREKGAITNVRVGVAPDGSAVLVWGAFGSSIWSSQFAAAGIWSAPSEVVADAGTRAPRAPDVAMAASGQAVLTWRENGVDQNVPTLATIKVKRMVGGVWQGTDVTLAADLPSPSGGARVQPRVVVNARGDALVVWSQEDNALRAAAAPASGAWSAPSVVKAADVSIFPREVPPIVAIDALGQAWVTWTQAPPGGNPDLYINRYTAAGWQQATVHENLNGPAESATSPALAMNARGEALIAWHQGIQVQQNVEQRIVVRRYQPGG